MADIQHWLDIIDNEPKGRLVKEAIYEALKAINAEAEIRPPAKREIPIGEMVADAGNFSEWLIGSMTAGEIGFSAEIRNGVGESTTKTATCSSIYAAQSGRLFVVTVGPWSDSVWPYPALDAGADVSDFQQIGFYKVNLRTRSGKGADPPISVDSVTTKGIIHSNTETPLVASDGDAYVCPERESDFIYGENAWNEFGWNTLDVLSHSESKYVSVWTGVINGPTGIEVTYADSNEATLGVFAVYDTEEKTVSEMDYRVCLVDNDAPGYVEYPTKAFDETTTYKGVIPVGSYLPTEGNEDGDMYYMEAGHRFYVFDADSYGWSADGTMYRSAGDYIDEIQNGTSEGTDKIYVCVALDPISDFRPHIVTTNSSVKSVACATGESCAMSAWYQSADSEAKPYFDYAKGREYYRWAANGSIAIIPLEIGERRTPNNGDQASESE